MVHELGLGKKVVELDVGLADLSAFETLLGTLLAISWVFETVLNNVLAHSSAFETSLDILLAHSSAFVTLLGISLAPERVSGTAMLVMRLVDLLAFGLVADVFSPTYTYGHALPRTVFWGNNQQPGMPMP